MARVVIEIDDPRLDDLPEGEREDFVRTEYREHGAFRWAIGAQVVSVEVVEA